MHVPGVMHMQHALEVFPVQPYPSMSPNTLIWHGSKQEPTMPHCECYPALPAIAQVEPLHRANAHG